MKRKYSDEKGQVIVENLLCILLVCLIFFGILQLFLMFVADSVTRYAAFVATRSNAVGFTEGSALRAAKVATIPAAGRRLKPFESKSARINASGMHVLIEEYLKNLRNLDYEYWDRGNEFDSSKAPFEQELETYLSLKSYSYMTTVETEVRFNDYPLALPMRLINFGTEYTDIEGEATFPNYASKFLE